MPEQVSENDSGPWDWDGMQRAHVIDHRGVDADSEGGKTAGTDAGDGCARTEQPVPPGFDAPFGRMRNEVADGGRGRERRIIIRWGDCDAQQSA